MDFINEKFNISQTINSEIQHLTRNGHFKNDAFSVYQSVLPVNNKITTQIYKTNKK